MKEYQKIPTLYNMGKNKKFIKGDFVNKYVEYLQNCKWIASEKIDGTNIRIHWDGYSFSIYGRTSNGQIPSGIVNLYTKLFNKDMELIVESIFENKEVTFCMEGYGDCIQGGIYKKDFSLIGYDIMVGESYMDRDKIKDIFDKMGLDCVKMWVEDSLDDCINYVMQDPDSIIVPETKMEGIVCTPLVKIYDHNHNRVIVKIKYRDLKRTVKGE